MKGVGDMETITGFIEVLENMPSSKSGNPRLRCKVVGEWCEEVLLTMPDDSLGYSLTSFNDRLVVAKVREYHGRRHIVAITEDLDNPAKGHWHGMRKMAAVTEADKEYREWRKQWDRDRKWCRRSKAWYTEPECPDCAKR
jgi:hypothetical protein